MKVFFIITLFISSEIFSQNVERVFESLPLRNGKVYELPSNLHGCYTESLTIFSNNDSCFASEDGEVVVILDLGGGGRYDNTSEFAVIMKLKNNNFVTYLHFMSLIHNRGDIVKRGDYLGKLLPTGYDENFELLYLISNNNGSFFSRQYQFQHLELSNTYCNVNSEIAL